MQVFTRDINSADLSNNVPISVSLSSLSVSTTYYVRVIAHNAVGPGQPCDQGGLLCDGAAVSQMCGWVRAEPRWWVRVRFVDIGSMSRVRCAPSSCLDRRCLCEALPRQE